MLKLGSYQPPKIQSSHLKWPEYALVRNLFCVFCLTNTGFVQCYSLGSRQVCCMLVFILLYSVVFCFACFASPTSGLCSAFPFGTPQVYTLYTRALPQQAPVGTVIFPRLSSNLHALFFALYYSVLSLCSAFFPSLI